MARIRFNHNTFATGMISKKLQGNTDFEKYNNALDECVNFNIQHTGGCFKRGGTLFVTESYKNAAYVKLVAFSYSYDNSYICEFGIYNEVVDSVNSDIAYVRLIHNKTGVVKSKEGVEIAKTGFTKIQMDDMTTYQYHNILYINIGNGIYHLKLTKDFFDFSAERIEYTVDPVTFHNKLPIFAKIIPLKKDGKEATVIKDIESYQVKFVNSKGGEVDGKYLPIFFDDDVPTSNYVREFVLNTIDSGFGNPNLTFRFAISDFKNIKSGSPFANVVFNNTGSSTNIKYFFTADKDKSIEGDVGIKSANNIPLIKRWQISAFTGSRGYPKIMCPFEGRLFLANTKEYPLGIWASSILYQDFFNFSTGSGDADALQVLPMVEKAEEILWMVGQSKLFIGTISGLYIFNSLEHSNEAITPSRCDVKLFQSIGVNKLNPITALDTIFFIDSSGMNVHELSLNENGFYEQYDLSLLSNELTASGIIAHAWQQNPIKTYWCAVNAGHLCSLTYLKQNQILAWSKHIIGGTNSKVTSIVSLFGDTNDQLYMVVNREVQGKRVNHIEYLKPMYDALNQEQFKQYYVDSGVIKERKYTIKKIGNINSQGEIKYDTAKTRHAHVTVGISYKIFSRINFNLDHFICFHNASDSEDAFLDKRTTYRISNLDSYGFDILHDIRWMNTKTKFTKIDPSEYQGYNYIKNTNKFIFYKIDVKILEVGKDNQTNVYLKITDNPFSIGDIILLHYTNNVFLDYSANKTHVFKVLRIDLNYVFITLENNDRVELDNGIITKETAEIYIRYSSIGKIDLGTNCYINLSGGLPDTILNYQIGQFNRISFIGDAFYFCNLKGEDEKSDNRIYRTKDGIYIEEVQFSLPSGKKNESIVYIFYIRGGKKPKEIEIGAVTISGKIIMGTITADGKIDFSAFYESKILNYTGTVNLKNFNLCFACDTYIYNLDCEEETLIFSIKTEPTGFVLKKVSSSLYNPDTETIYYTFERSSDVYKYKIAAGIPTVIDYNNSLPIKTTIISMAYMKKGNDYKYIAMDDHAVYATIDPTALDSWSNPLVEKSKLLKVVCNGEIFIIILYDSFDIFISEDGDIWEKIKNANLIKAIDITFNGDLFVSISKDQVSYSKDGRYWFMNEENNEVYINKVPNMDQINGARYKLSKKYEPVTEGGETTQGVILYDIDKSPSVSNKNYAPLDTSNYSEFNYVTESTGNLYLYFKSIEGLDHLVGEEVNVNCEGNKYKDVFTVSGSGVIRLSDFCMYASAGLPFKAYIKTVPFSGGSVIGSSVGAVGSQKDMSLHLYTSIGGKYGAEYDPNNNYPIKYKYDDTEIKSNTAIKLFTGFLKLALPNSKSIYDRTIYIEHDDPTCFNILAVAHDIWVSDS